MSRKPNALASIGIRHPLSLAVAAALGIFCTSSVIAAENEDQLKEMTVSADTDKPIQQRTELGTLNEYTPLAGTVVSRDELETVRFVDSLRELLTRVPGVSKIRNMRIPDGGKNYTEARIDGMRSADSGTTSFLDAVNADDIERVEIIAGPGSVLSGSNAYGGTINVITRDAPKTPELRFLRKPALTISIAPVSGEALLAAVGARVRSAIAPDHRKEAHPQEPDGSHGQDQPRPGRLPHPA